MPHRIRYAITGFGRFAEKAIAPAINQSHNSELVAIQNRSLAKAQSRASSLNLSLAFDSVSELVAHSDIDAIFISSPNSFHCEETLLAAQAGKHVLCEKPMATNVAECQRMIDACTRNNVKLMVGHMLRLSPLVRRMKELVQSGAIGKIIRAESNFVYDGRLSTRSWLLDRKIAGGGPTFDVGVHCLDTLRFILEDEVVSVQKELKPKPTVDKTESSSQLLLRFSKGIPATIFTSYETPLRQSYLEILGTEARISAIDFTINAATAALKIEPRSEKRPPEFIAEQITVPDLYVDEVNQFSDCIINDKEPLLSGFNAMQNQRVLDVVMHEER
jgi:1,5-anhydro-D-fructose reductase (1,5-anhydro-D-mannitol-forming)